MEVRSVGEDLAERMGEIHSMYGAADQTFNLFLNMNSAAGVAAYHELSAMGYFFTGIKPICGEREYMALHRAGDVPVSLDALRLTEPFAELRDYVRECYKKAT